MVVQNTVMSDGVRADGSFGFVVRFSPAWLLMIPLSANMGVSYTMATTVRGLLFSIDIANDICDAQGRTSMADYAPFYHISHIFPA